MKNVIRSIAMLSIAAFALSIPASSAFAAGTPDSTTIPQLFQHVKHHAAQASFDVDILETFRRSNVNWETYGQTLNQIRKHVNDLFEDYYQLKRMRNNGTPAQQQAIDRLEPLLRDMATSLTSTIQALNADQRLVNMPGFRARIRANWVKIHAVYKLLCQCTSKNLLA